VGWAPDEREIYRLKDTSPSPSQARRVPSLSPLRAERDIKVLLLARNGPELHAPSLPRGRLDVPRPSADSRLLVVVDVLTEFERLVCSGGDR
jgi:hypothetical protein